MSDTVPRQGDTDNRLLHKILRQLRGEDTGASSNVSISNTPNVTLVNDQVGGFTTNARTALVVSGGAFSANDAVGGVFSVSLFRAAVGTGIIQSVTVVDPDNQKAALDVVFFSANPSASTFTNNAAAVLAAADEAKVLGKVSIGAGDYANVGAAAAVATVSNASIPVSSGETVYVAIVTSGTPTYAGGEIHVTIGALQD